MKFTKKQSSEFVVDFTILFIIGIILFALAFFVGDIVTKKVLDVEISDIVHHIPILVLIGSYLFTSMIYGVEAIEGFLKQRSKGFRIFSWFIFPIIYILALLIGIITFIPAFIIMLGFAIFKRK